MRDLQHLTSYCLRTPFMNKILFYLSIQNMADQTTKLETNDILNIVNEIITKKFQKVSKFKKLQNLGMLSRWSFRPWVFFQLSCYIKCENGLTK